MKMKKAITIYLAALVLFTSYVLLDTFFIPRSYQKVQKTKSTEVSQYESADISITEYDVDQTVVYVADVITHGPDAIKTAFAYDTFGKNIKATTSEIAEQNGALFAINGDFYGARSSGFVVRDGVVYRSVKSGRYDLAIMDDGSFDIVSEDETTPDELVERGARHVFSFGPPLIDNGSLLISRLYDAGIDDIYRPRAAIGIIEENHYVFLATDGRTCNSEGLSIYQLARFMEELGCQCAYNLDGGGSVTMYYNGEVLNETSTYGDYLMERKVSDIVYIR